MIIFNTTWMITVILICIILLDFGFYFLLNQIKMLQFQINLLNNLYFKRERK